MAVADAANDAVTHEHAGRCRGATGVEVDRGADPTRVVEVHAAVDVLARVDLAQCREADLESLRGASQRLRGFVAAADARIARRSQELVDEWRRGPVDDHADAGDAAGDEDDVGCDGDRDAVDDHAGDGDGDGARGDGEHGDEGLGGFGGTRDRRSSEEADRDRLRGRAGAAMPSFEAALEDGEIDAAHVDAVATALQRLDDADARGEFVAREAQLLGYARVENPQRFRRRCRDLARRLQRDHGRAEARTKKAAARIRQWWDDRAGLGHLHLTLDAETWARLDEAMQSHLSTVLARDENRGRHFEELRVDSFIELVTASSAVDARVPEISVLIDWDTLRTGVFGETGVSESASAVPLTPDAVRRMACDGRILPVVLGGDAVPLDVGRSRRLATPAQRRALAAMYGTCAHPHCNRPISWCQVHHVGWWELGGSTDLGNLVPLCDRHHHEVHDGGWTLAIDADRVLTWTTPAGTVWFSGNTCDRPPADWGAPAVAVAGAGSGGSRRSGGSRDDGGRPVATPAGDLGRRHLDPSMTANGTIAGRPAPVIALGVSGRGVAGDPTADPGARRRRRSRHAGRTGTTLFDHDTEPAGP